MIRRSIKSSGIKRRLAIYSLLALALAYAIGLMGFVSRLESRPSEVKSADAIVALTGGDARLAKAMELLANRRGKRLLISGVHDDVTRDQLFLQIGGPRDLFDCCVDIGRGASSTAENAQEAAQWIRDNGYQSVILVTAAYHMPRSKLEMAYAMPQIRFLAQPVFPEDVDPKNWWADKLSAWVVGFEYTKYVFAWTRLSAFGALGLTTNPEPVARINYGKTRPGNEPRAVWEAEKAHRS
jgi:uncharacterized SAM-binding protein YcdF (DUF218 family)